MSDAIVKLLLEEHRPDLLDAIERAANLHLGTAQGQRLDAAVASHLEAALRRAYEMGYREALAARARAEAAKSMVAGLAEEPIGFPVAPPPEPQAVAPLRDEQAEREIAEMRALVSHFGETPAATEPPRPEHTKHEKVDLSLFGEALPEEPEADEDDAESVPESEIEAPPGDEAPELDALDPEAAGASDDELDDGEDDDGEAKGDPEAPSAKQRVRRTNAEIAATDERVFAYIKDHPGTKAGPGRDALGVDYGEWQGAARRLSQAGRIFFAGATKARVYFPIEATKRGKPKKLTKSAFILALPSDLSAAEVVAAAKPVGLEFDERYVHGVRASDRRREKQAKQAAAAAARAQAITERFHAVAQGPRDPDGYRELRRAFTQDRRTDGIWLACQALVGLGAAEPSEQMFYEARRPETAAHAHAVLAPDLRARHILHPGADPRVTLVIDYLLPALLERYGRPTAAQGYTDAHRLDPSQHSLLSQTLIYGAQVLGLTLPPIYLHSLAPMAIFSIHGDQPTIGLGAPAAALTDGRDAAFIAANHLTYLLPGYYARRLVPQEPELRRWVDAALALSRGATQFEHLSHLEQTMLVTQVDPDERKIIVRETAGLEARDLDLPAWFKAVDATADRLGLLLGHDLERVQSLLRGGQTLGDDALETRLDALRTWSVSEDYLAVRAALVIAVE
jgi:hypothetical protein